jgi:hypothetical protein
MNIGIRMHDAAPGTLSERAGFIREQGFSCVHLALSKTIDPKLMEPAAATPGLAAQVRHDLGDIDLDGDVDVDDVIRLLLHVTMPDEFSIQTQADFNGDSAVDVKDVIRLLLHVTMPDEFPLN